MPAFYKLYTECILPIELLSYLGNMGLKAREILAQEDVRLPIKAGSTRKAACQGREYNNALFYARTSRVHGAYNAY